MIIPDVNILVYAFHSAAPQHKPAHIRLHSSLEDILRLKTAYRVPALAMLRAAHSHGKLSEREYQTHLTTLSERGFRKAEPGSNLQYERSRIFDYVLSSEGGARIADIADATKLPAQDLHSLMLDTIPHTVATSPRQTPGDLSAILASRGALKLRRAQLAPRTPRSMQTPCTYN